MYEVGDKIILIRRVNNYEEGQIFTIKRDSEGKISWGKYNENIGYTANNWQGELSFILYKKKEQMTEVDYLDAFQQNFKEGV